MIEQPLPGEQTGHGLIVEEVKRDSASSKKGEGHIKFTQTHWGIAAVRKMSGRWDVSIEEAETRFNQVITGAYSEYADKAIADGNAVVGFNTWFEAQMIDVPKDPTEPIDEVRAAVFQVTQEQWALEHQGLYSPMD